MYNYFAYRYDELTGNIDYDAGSDYISGFLNEQGIGEASTLLDLACGTGTMSLLLKNRGYRVTGIDLSEEMLSVADHKAQGEIPFIKADMRDFRLEKPVDACVCCLDSLNHLASIEDVEATFKCVHESLKDGGIFIFDVNTVYKHNCVLADNSFIFDEEDYFLAWDNELLEDDRVRIMLDFFVFNRENYDRYSEEFVETAFSEDSLRAALSPYFEVLGVYDELTLNPPKPDSERIYFVCKRI